MEVNIQPSKDAGISGNPNLSILTKRPRSKYLILNFSLFTITKYKMIPFTISATAIEYTTLLKLFSYRKNIVIVAKRTISFNNTEKKEYKPPRSSIRIFSMAKFSIIINGNINAIKYIEPYSCGESNRILLINSTLIRIKASKTITKIMGIIIAFDIKRLMFSFS